MSLPLRSNVVVLAFIAACASPGTRPHDMSAAQHEEAARRDESSARSHAARYDATTRTARLECLRGGTRTVTATPGSVCWQSTVNPTESHSRESEALMRRAAEHRAASAALRSAEARACAGLSAEDRDLSPFSHRDDIASVAELPMRRVGRAGPTPNEYGATVRFRAVPGMTAEWLQRVVDCHLARNASMGHQDDTMPACPLVPRGARARVRSTGNGFAVDVWSEDIDIGQEILARARHLTERR